MRMMVNNENEKYLTTQIITYLGNKRSLLSFIGEAVNIVKRNLCKDTISVMDPFSGSGIVSRYLKHHASRIIASDLEDYSFVLNSCYLSNKSALSMDDLVSYYNYITKSLDEGLFGGFVADMYAPNNTEDIKRGERCFYTTRNAMYIDTARIIIGAIPKEYQHFFIAPLLTEASIKNNTSGVFKGFYKNSKTGIGQFGGNNEFALSRIKKDIELPFPVFSNYECSVEVYKEDAICLAKTTDVVDLVYMDPPYNQHPYGSNYFMLNLITNYNKPSEVSAVSGIPTDWHRSKFNQSKEALNSLEELCNEVKAKYILLSYNSDGFIRKEEMLNMLSKIGSVIVMDRSYNTFRGSRNLDGRDIYVKEYLYLVETNKYKETILK